VTNDYPFDSVTELNSKGELVGNFAPAGANFNEASRVALDSAGDVWVTNRSPEKSSVTVLVGLSAPVLTPR
jgi:hypothetical protein